MRQMVIDLLDDRLTECGLPVAVRRVVHSDVRCLESDVRRSIVPLLSNQSGCCPANAAGTPQLA